MMRLAKYLQAFPSDAGHRYGPAVRPGHVRSGIAQLHV